MTMRAVYSPFNGAHIKDVPRSDEQQALNMLHLADSTFADRKQWLPAYERKAILERLLVLMRAQHERLAIEATLEGGKPIRDSRIEVDRAIIGIQCAIAQIDNVVGREIPMNITPSSAHHLAYTFREPVGVVVAISAFNHPLNLIVHQVIPAIAVGCPVLVKPASSTPISCFNLVELLYAAGLPTAWCQVISCDASVAEKIVADPRTRFLSFIGSAAVGWKLRAKLPPGANCVLEHGGAAPIIIEPDADLTDVLPTILKSAFYHAGQICVSAQRIFVHETICTAFIRELATLTSKLHVGDPLLPVTDVGPLITAADVDRIADWVQLAIDAGAILLTGGQRLSKTMYQPTVLLNPPEDALVSQQEIFGPVVCCYSYSDRLHAYRQANALPFAFQAAIYTKNLDVALEASRQLEATAVMINEATTFRVDWMPFGGRKHSGLNMGGIPYSMHDMTYEKMLVIKSTSLPG